MGAQRLSTLASTATRVDMAEVMVSLAATERPLVSPIVLVHTQHFVVYSLYEMAVVDTDGDKH